MPQGIVKWFNNAKGYGFIEPDEGEGDVFVHFSAVQMDGYRTLRQGEPVAFEVIDGPKGKQATNVSRPEGLAAEPMEAEEMRAAAGE